MQYLIDIPKEASEYGLDKGDLYIESEAYNKFQTRQF